MIKRILSDTGQSWTPAHIFRSYTFLCMKKEGVMKIIGAGVESYPPENKFNET
jgi:hypothetical protein